MRISDWSSDVCSSDLKPIAQHVIVARVAVHNPEAQLAPFRAQTRDFAAQGRADLVRVAQSFARTDPRSKVARHGDGITIEPEHEGRGKRLRGPPAAQGRSEEHTSELQSLMRTSSAVFCLKKKKERNNKRIYNYKYQHRIIPTAKTYKKNKQMETI